MAETPDPKKRPTRPAGSAADRDRARSAAASARKAAPRPTTKNRLAPEKKKPVAAPPVTPAKPVAETAPAKPIATAPKTPATAPRKPESPTTAANRLAPEKKVVVATPTPAKPVVAERPVVAEATTVDQATPEKKVEPVVAPVVEAPRAAPTSKKEKKKKKKSKAGMMWVVWTLLMVLLVGGGALLYLFTDFFAQTEHQQLAAEAGAMEEMMAEAEAVEEEQAETAAEETSEDIESEQEGIAGEETEVAETAAEEIEPEPELVSTKTVPTELSGQLIVSLAASSKESNAQAEAERYKQKGFSNANYYFIPDLEPGGKELYKVYLGPFDSNEEVRQAMAKLKGVNDNAYIYKMP